MSRGWLRARVGLDSGTLGTGLKPGAVRAGLALGFTGEGLELVCNKVWYLLHSLCHVETLSPWAGGEVVWVM